MQTSKFYASTGAYCGTASCSAILDVSWFAITDFQQKCFRGAAEVFLRFCFWTLEDIRFLFKIMKYFIC